MRIHRKVPRAWIGVCFELRNFDWPSSSSITLPTAMYVVLIITNSLMMMLIMENVQHYYIPLCYTAEAKYIITVIVCLVDAVFKRSSL